MANTTPMQKGATSTAFDAVTHLQEAGLGKLMGLGTAGVEAMAAMSAEVAEFVAQRIKEDVKTQQEILHCKNVADLQHIQTEFLQKAIDQYQSETNTLVDMSSKAFMPTGKGT